MTGAFRLIVFDLDGTLIDSRKDIADAANLLLRDCGAEPLAEDRIGRMVGAGAATLVARAFAAIGIEPPPDALERFLAIYSRGLLNHTRAYNGIPDVLDNCPHEKGTLLNHGCPSAKKQMVAVRDDRIELFEKIYFSSGTAVITPASLRLIDQIAGILKSHPNVLKVSVDGHTDSRGNPVANTRLSRQRAEAVVRALVARGVPRARLEARGLGSSQPIAPNNTAAGRDLNRRVELSIVERRAGDSSINPSEAPR